MTADAAGAAGAGVAGADPRPCRGRCVPSSRSSWPCSSVRSSSCLELVTDRVLRPVPARSSPTGRCSRVRSARLRAVVNTLVQATPLVLGGPSVGSASRPGCSTSARRASSSRRARRRRVGRGLATRRAPSRSRPRSWPGCGRGVLGLHPGRPEGLSRAPTRSSRRSCSTRRDRRHRVGRPGPLLAPGFSFGRDRRHRQRRAADHPRAQRPPRGPARRRRRADRLVAAVPEHARVRDPDRRARTRTRLATRGCGPRFLIVLTMTLCGLLAGLAGADRDPRRQPLHDRPRTGPRSGSTRSPSPCSGGRTRSGSCWPPCSSAPCAPAPG